MSRQKQTKNPSPTRGATMAPPVQLTRTDFTVAAATALIAFVIYLFTLAPTVTGEDSGELTTAAYTLGIPHPPGYPLWCMLGKLFSLIPIGSVAWRINLMSAFWAAATVATLCVLVLKLTRSRAAAFAAALTFAFSCDFWGQSVIAEIYTLNAFLIALCTLILITWQEHRRNAYLYAFAAVYGLGLCNHHTMHFLGPVFALFILRMDYVECGGNATALAKFRWHTYSFILLIAFILWFLIHLYLPFRSLANPVMDWGNPETWQNFWNVVLRRQYGSQGFSANPHSLTRLTAQLYTVATIYLHQFTPLLAILPLLGLRPLMQKDKPRAALIAGAAAYIIIGFILILNFDADRQSIWVNSTFFLPAHMMAAILAGVAIDWLINLRPNSRWLATALTLVFLLPLVMNYHTNDRSQYYWAHDNAMNIFDSLEPNAVYFPTGDHRVFPLIYLQTVENVRPDVSIADKYGYIEESLYAKMPPQIKARISNPPTEQDTAFIQEWLAATSPNPMYFSKKTSMRSLPDAATRNAGLVYKLVRKGEQPPTRDYWNEYQWHTLDPQATRGEYSADVILSDYHYFLGQHYFEKGETEKALEEMHLAAQQIGRCKENLNNIGIACVENKQYEAGRKYYEMALDVDPDFISALRNLARILALLNDPQQAVHCLDRAVQSARHQHDSRGPLVAACLNELAIISAGMVPIDTTVDFYRQTIKAIETTPDPAASIYLNNLGVALLEQGNPQEASTWFERALHADQAAVGPSHPDVGRDLSNLSIATRKIGNTAEANRLQQQALAILVPQCGEENYMTQQARQGKPIVGLGK